MVMIVVLLYFESGGKENFHDENLSGQIQRDDKLEATLLSKSNVVLSAEKTEIMPVRSRCVMSPAREDIYVDVGTPADKERVFRFLKENFFPYEPVSQSIGFPNGPPKISGVKSIRGLDLGTVLIAKDRNSHDRIAGVAMCMLEGADKGMDPPGHDFEDPADKAVLKTLRTLFASIDEAGIKNADDTWPKDRPVLHLNILCTASDQRGRGVAKTLASAVVDLGRHLNVGAVAAHCTGPTSLHVLSSAGFRKICKVPYDHIPKAMAGANITFVMINL